MGLSFAATFPPLATALQSRKSLTATGRGSFLSGRDLLLLLFFQIQEGEVLKQDGTIDKTVNYRNRDHFPQKKAGAFPISPTPLLFPLFVFTIKDTSSGSCTSMHYCQLFAAIYP
jgi:hypothetical protein